LALKGAPHRRPKYFKGKKDTAQPRIVANPSTLCTLYRGTKSNLARLFFKLDTISKHKKKAYKKWR
jgi:hypothetical protein